MLKTKVLANAITNLTDARYFAAWEVEWLGFLPEPGADGYLEMNKISAIKEWVDGVKIMACFYSSSVERIQETIKLLDLDAVMVGPFTDIETLIALKDIYCIQEIVPQLDQDITSIKDLMEENAPYCNAFLIDFSKNGIALNSLEQKTQISKTELKDLCSNFPILLSFDFNTTDLETLLSEYSVKGIILKGGEEEKVGVKSYEELDDLLEILYEEED